MDVAAWLGELGLQRYVESFAGNDVDAATLCHLTEADLTELGVRSVGHRRKLIDAIARLSDGPAGAGTGIEAARPSVSPLQAEHRQISVLYCDMVDSTGRSERLDPEDYREVIRSFHDTCVRTVVEYDGWVANFIGDCVLAYFGWPRAHEDDPERAVRAGLAVARAVADSGVEVRASVATGSVVVGDLIREGPAQEQSAVGMTPNLAAGLQSLAAPGQMVIDELTRRLAPTFAVQALGSHQLKGLPAPVAVYAVQQERRVDSRFDASTGPALAPMLGRDHELALLTDRWALAQGGEGQAVLLVGEAGIGKSRIARALLDACAAQPHSLVRWQCSPYHTGSALWPVIQRLGRTAGLQDEDSADTALDKLEAAVGGNGEAAALYATLLGLNTMQRYGPLGMTPQVLRERTLEFLVERLFEMAEALPLLLLVEDAHWIDPTTLALIDHCLARIEPARFLLLITSRPDNQPSLGAHPGVTRLSLNRLSRPSVAAIVQRLAGEALQAHTLTAIVARADGVPLFAEELTKAVLETSEEAIPASLHGSLMARLDHLPDVRDVAQMAACIGREFSLALLQAVAERPEAVSPALDRLASAELVFRRGDQANPRFAFKHALVQEAAHKSLLRERRLAIHARILHVIEAHAAGAALEELAHHAAMAGLWVKAVQYWRQAGEAAQLKSAYHEAASHFSQAIDLVETHGELRDDSDREFLLQLRLAQALLPAAGLSAGETVRAFQRAHALVGRTSDPSLALQARYGVWVGQWNRGDFAQSLQLAREWLASLASRPEDLGLQLAHRLAGASLSQMGRLAEAVEHFELALDLYDPERHRGLTTLLGSEPGAITCCQLASTVALLGSTARAVASLERAQELVASPSSANASAQATPHSYAGMCAALWRDAQMLQRESRRLGELANRHRLSLFRGYTFAYAGSAALLQSQHDEAVVQLEQALAIFASSHTRLATAYFRSGLALSLASSDRIDAARQQMQWAIRECEATGGRWCEAELWRVRGELLLIGDQADLDEAARSFERALSLAQAQGARLWELRTALSLARLLSERGQRTRGHDVLAACGPLSTDGVNADTKDARTLLGQLSP
jgi:class 3 adenylate cyclase/tetratricopeptide (TPR) repeat protein